jgi:protein PhnA
MDGTAGYGSDLNPFEEAGMMSDENEIIVKDCNGTRLHDGDTVHVIKDLKVKGTSSVIKQGTKIKGIRLTDSEDEIECRVENIKGLVLKTQFLKRVNG